MCPGTPPPEDARLRIWRRSAKRSKASIKSLSVDSSRGIDAGTGEALAQAQFARRGKFGKAPPEPLVMRIDKQLFAALGILQEKHAEIRQFVLKRIRQAHRDHLMASRQPPQGLLPAPAC